MHGKAYISSSERSTSFQLRAWASPVYRHLNATLNTSYNISLYEIHHTIYLSIVYFVMIGLLQGVTNSQKGVQISKSLDFI